MSWIVDNWLDNPCVEECEVLDRRTVWRTWQSWREIYARELHAKTGKWKIHPFNWHVFSYGHAVNLDGEEARQEYAEISDRVVYILSDLNEQAGVRAQICCPPMFDLPVECVPEDVCVASLSFSWCMVFTHEEDWDLGPYFSRQEWQ